MKYKDFKTLSLDEMKTVNGGRACIPENSGCSITFQNCCPGFTCQIDGLPSNTVCIPTIES